MLPQRGQKGFTLIELLIVIAIIGILAAVLIPNLMAARAAAQDRAAQAHSAQVFQAINAVLAEDVNAVLEDETGLSDWADQDCGNGDGDAVFTTANSGEYSVSDPGAAVASCDIDTNDEGELEVTVTSINGPVYVNGRLQAEDPA